MVLTGGPHPSSASAYTDTDTDPSEELEMAALPAGSTSIAYVNDLYIYYFLFDGMYTFYSAESAPAPALTLFTFQIGLATSYSLNAAAQVNGREIIFANVGFASNGAAQGNRAAA